MSSRWSACLAVVVLGAALACEQEPPLTFGLEAKDHEVYFPITNGATHPLGLATVGGPLSCDSCHGGKDSFEQFKCLECHQFDQRAPAVVHAGIAGYVPDNPICLSCHPTGVRGSEQGVALHSERSFPIDEGSSHASPEYVQRAGEDLCLACHASAIDRSLLLCAECHALDVPSLEDTHAALERSFSNDTVSCKECHGETPVSPSVTPLSNHNAFFDPNHHDATCKNCHSTSREPPKEWTIEFGIATCNACHSNPECTPANLGVCLPL